MADISDIKQISAEELAAMLDHESLIVVDIRDKESYRKGHVPRALSVQADQDVKSFLEKADRSKTIVCCCYHGISSRRAAAYFQTQGFQDVRSLDGGFEGWKEAQRVEI